MGSGDSQAPLDRLPAAGPAVSAPQDLKGKAALQEEGSVLLTERELQYRALQPPKGGVEADLRGLMASSDEPLSHTAADAGKIFSLERSSAFASLFFHTGLCGKGRQEQAAKTAAALVWPEVLELRDELLWRAARPADAQHSLRDSSGLVLVGERGHGKSWALNYAAAACEAAGWLVVLAPWAADWTMGVGARSAQVRQTRGPCETRAQRSAERSAVLRGAQC